MPRELPPLCVSPRPIVHESLLLRELGPVWFYYGLAHRLFDLGEWVCFPLLVVSTVGWEFFSFRLGFRRVLGSFLSGPLSHLLLVVTQSTGRGFLCRPGPEGFSLGVAGWTVVGGFGLRGPCLVEGPSYLGLWDEHRCAFAPIETVNNGDYKKIK